MDQERGLIEDLKRENEELKKEFHFAREQYRQAAMQCENYRNRLEDLVAKHFWAMGERQNPFDAIEADPEEELATMNREEIGRLEKQVEYWKGEAGRNTQHTMNQINENTIRRQIAKIGRMEEIIEELQGKLDAAEMQIRRMQKQ